MQQAQVLASVPVPAAAAPATPVGPRADPAAAPSGSGSKGAAAAPEAAATSLCVRCIGGELGNHSWWGPAQWASRLRHTDVLVATPAALVHTLVRAYIKVAAGARGAACV